MPAKALVSPAPVTEQLVALGQQVRARRKALRVSATAAAQAAGMSRVTWHRIEEGEASVTMGAYLNAMAALSLGFGIQPLPGSATEPGRAAPVALPGSIRLADYPQLKRLAWHVHGLDELTPAEALGIYERQWRHLDLQAMEPHERYLVDTLRQARPASDPDV